MYYIDVTQTTTGENTMTSYYIDITLAETHNLIGTNVDFVIEVDHCGEYTKFQDIEHAIDDVLFEKGLDVYPSSATSWKAYNGENEVVFECVKGKELDKK